MIRVATIPGTLQEYDDTPRTVAEYRALQSTSPWINEPGHRYEASIDGKAIRRCDENERIVPPDGVLVFSKAAYGHPAPPEYYHIKLPCNVGTVPLTAVIKHYFFPDGEKPYSHAHHLNDMSIHCPFCALDHLHLQATYIGDIPCAPAS